MERQLYMPKLIAALLLLAMLPSAHAEVFSYVSGSVQSFTAPVTGIYSVLALGAAGGTGRQSAGLGASASGDLFLAAGQVVSVLVGGKGENTANGTGGGGGGTFIYTGTTVLFAAGGGGGSGLSSSGTSSSLLGGSGLGGAGGASAYSNGGGGTGFYQNGVSGVGSNSGVGGRCLYVGTPANAWLGGSGFPNATFAGAGGWGGGGGGGFVGGGGGGGYTGGNGGKGRSDAAAFSLGGDAGTSYFDNTVVSNFVLTGGVNAGDGSLTITAVPEPSTYAMALAGLACGGYSMWRRRKRA